jgi:hypothetical protein
MKKEGRDRVVNIGLQNERNVALAIGGLIIIVSSLFIAAVVFSRNNHPNIGGDHQVSPTSETLKVPNSKAIQRPKAVSYALALVFTSAAISSVAKVLFAIQYALGSQAISMILIGLVAMLAIKCTPFVMLYYRVRLSNIIATTVGSCLVALNIYALLQSDFANTTAWVVLSLIDTALLMAASVLVLLPATRHWIRTSAATS